jgi:SAM-dependent methyltransferase
MLDVGCGSGEWVRLAQTYGWDAQGVDVDAKAVENARNKGLNVRLGTLVGQRYAESSFDLITMGHVIEHVHDPAGLLKECHRVLRPNGVMVSLTPNIASIGHRRFGVHWLPLDPPRHLLLFTPNTLVHVAQRAGFQHIRVGSTLRANRYTESASRRIRDGDNPNGPFTSGESLWAVLLTFPIQVRLWFNPLLGDELLLEARK